MTPSAEVSAIEFGSWMSEFGGGKRTEATGRGIGGEMSDVWRGRMGRACEAGWERKGEKARIWEGASRAFGCFYRFITLFLGMNELS